MEIYFIGVDMCICIVNQKSPSTKEPSKGACQRIRSRVRIYVVRIYFSTLSAKLAVIAERFTMVP